MNEIEHIENVQKNDEAPSSLALSLTARHKPDILDCIANLSSDEVFTSPAVVNKMLDLLPADVWTNPDLKFLDPGCKSGVFLREAAKRLMEGLEVAIPDETQRREHIFRNMLYGIAITELTAQIARRTLYYTKDASSEHAAVRFETSDGNIHYENGAHTFKNGSCVHCGAPESYDSDSENKESHAYSFIHDNPFKHMKFDVIIGNPPYQLKDGGHGASASPLYHKFVTGAMALNPRYLSMIIPARWYAGGKGLDEFRAKMLADHRMSVLVDHADAGECFPGVEIKGGVCYFLWDREKSVGHGCLVRNLSGNEVDESIRGLDEQDIFIRFNKAVSILKKVKALNEPTLDALVSSRKPFGFPTNFDDYERRPFPDAVKLYARGETGWIAPDKIVVNREWVGKWKVLTAMAAEGDGKFPNKVTGKPIVAEPQTLCTETYLVAGNFSNKKEAENFERYLKTRFLRFLVGLRKNTQHLTRDRFAFVPQLDMNRTWTDADLYARYNLTHDEIAYIESMIKEMP